ncbi:MAG: ATP synthase F1 subunit epsilon [Bacteroidetes bacterium GWF2_38_335]|nr:MAG: ATP synthase F1 subunit epsilon [Bacteroidetes bacterium GWF2_38_335]OFY81301.1 MAG: ATP synthase F1 subunit epsilon [Bacteroidetes bacterium RIFOXYA12_FULL_38_20]HBS85421.1 ATP synthase F1 subunit epsilon [Bacteroidales bacterium]
MFIEILTPDKKIFEGEAELVQVPGSNGSFEILNNHAPIISTLGEGKIKVVSEGKKEDSFQIKSGVIEVLKNKIIVLIET